MPFEDIIGHSLPIKWLRNAIESNRLAHAYLFVGEEAIGKRLTAIRFAQAINCDLTLGPSLDSCGHCRSCSQIAAEIHPDFLVIRPDQTQSQNPQIKIDRVRDIEHHVIYRPLIGQHKICLIDDADRLTGSAANALLKTLEEPPDHSLFVLVTSRPSALLSTIKSRCLSVRFSPPTRDQLEALLVQQRDFSASDARLVSLLVGLRLGEALQFDMEKTRSTTEELFSLLSGDSLRSISDLLDKVETLSKAGKAMEVLTWLWYGLRDLLFVAVGCSQETLVHQDRFQALQALAQQTSPKIILELFEELQRLEQGLQRNLNIQLGLERFFLHLRDGILTPSG